MIVKSLLAGALSLVLSPSLEYTDAASFVADPYIEKISCGDGTGTGFKLSTGQWVSAHHVTSNGDCRVDGKPIQVLYYDEQKDYSIFAVPGDRRRGGLKADCSGFRHGEWYHGQGHARGLPVVTSVPVMFSRVMQSRHPREWALLIYNRFIPGQSGGAVKSNSGQVAGIVNAYAIYFPGSFSIALKDTKICQG